MRQYSSVRCVKATKLVLSMKLCQTLSRERISNLTNMVRAVMLKLYFKNNRRMWGSGSAGIWPATRMWTGSMPQINSLRGTPAHGDSAINSLIGLVLPDHRRLDAVKSTIFNIARSKCDKVNVQRIDAISVQFLSPPVVVASKSQNWQHQRNVQLYKKKKFKVVSHSRVAKTNLGYVRRSVVGVQQITLVWPSPSNANQSPNFSLKIDG